MQFKLANIAVTVRGSFFVVAALLAYDRIAQPAALGIWVAVVFVSVLTHELGHALAFLRYGHAPSIELYAMGGVTRIYTDMAVISVTPDGLVLNEVAPGLAADEVQAVTDAPLNMDAVGIIDVAA